MHTADGGLSQHTTLIVILHGCALCQSVPTPTPPPHHTALFTIHPLIDFKNESPFNEYFIHPPSIVLLHNTTREMYKQVE